MKLIDFLIILSVVLSLYAWGTPGDLAFSKNALLRGDYDTLVTGIFVHANFVHLIGNMLFLYIFGRILEEKVGALRTATVFFTGGVLSFILSIPFYPDVKMVGASAAIFAIMAVVLLIRRPGYSLMFLSPIGPLALLFFVFNIIAIQNGEMGNVAYISHVIGFIIGMFFGARWNRKWKESLMYTVLLLVVYIILVDAAIYILRL